MAFPASATGGTLLKSHVHRGAPIPGPTPLRRLGVGQHPDALGDDLTGAAGLPRLPPSPPRQAPLDQDAAALAQPPEFQARSALRRSRIWRGRCWCLCWQRGYPEAGSLGTEHRTCGRTSFLQTPPTPGLRLCIIKPTGFLRLFRECYPCFARRYRFCHRKKANLLNDALG